MKTLPTTDEVAAQEAAEDARARQAGRDPLDFDDEVPELRVARLVQPLYEDALRRKGHRIRTEADVIADAEAARARSAAAAQRSADRVAAIDAAYAEGLRLSHPAARP